MRMLQKDFQILEISRKEGKDIDSFQLKCYRASYNLQNKSADAHQTFADLLGVSRMEAKKLCYRILYDYNRIKELENESKNVSGVEPRSRALQVLSLDKGFERAPF